jgi:hypothetical protein
VTQLPPGFVLDQAPQASGLPDGFVLDQPKPVERLPGQNPAVDAVMQGLTFGFSDEIGAGIRSLVQGTKYKDELERERASLKAYSEEHPIGSTVLEVGGSILAPGGALVKGIKSGAAVGAGAGALYGAGTGETGEDRVNRAVSGGLVGSALGGLLGRFARPSAPTPQLAGTTATGQQAIQSAERLGVDLPRIAATESIPLKRIGLTASKVPYGGTPIQEAIESSSQSLGKRVAQVADDFGGGAAASRDEAGSAVRSGVSNYIGPVTSSRVKTAYDAVDQHVNKSVLSPLAETKKIADEITAQRADAALAGTGTAVDQVTAALGRPNGLNYEGIKKLRSSIGEMLEGGPLPSGISGSEMKRIYGALTQDLKTAVQNTGGQRGLQAFERANKLNALVSRRREDLAKMLGSKSDETLFDTIQRMAGSKGGANLELLSKARKAMPAQEWNEVASAVVSRLGQATKGNVETFSPQKFLTEYGNLTQQGKAMLFGSTGRNDLRAALDDIQKVSERLADLGQYANPSGTAQMGIATGLGAVSFAEAAFTGGLPLTTMAGVLGTRLVSASLAKPATARSLANWSKAYELAITKPARGTLSAFQAASRRFASDVGETLGLRAHVTQIAEALQGSLPTMAEDQERQ